MKLLMDTCVYGGALSEIESAGHDVIWTSTMATVTTPPAIAFPAADDIHGHTNADRLDYSELGHPH